MRLKPMVSQVYYCRFNGLGVGPVGSLKIVETVEGFPRLLVTGAEAGMKKSNRESRNSHSGIFNSPVVKSGRARAISSGVVSKSRR